VIYVISKKLPEVWGGGMAPPLDPPLYGVDYKHGYILDLKSDICGRLLRNSKFNTTIAYCFATSRIRDTFGNAVRGGSKQYPGNIHTIFI